MVMWGLRRGVCVIGVIAIFLSYASGVFAQEKIKIAILRQLDIKPFFDSEEGTKKALADLGYDQDKVEFISVSAKGNITAIADIVTELRKANVKIISPIGTLATIEVLKNVKDIPVVFSIVSYTESLTEAGKKFGFSDNYTGALQNSPAELEIDLAIKAAEVKKVGMIFNANEDNAKRDKDNLEKGCKKFGIECITLPYTEEAKLVETFQQLADMGIKCIVFPKDTLVIKHLEEIKKIIYANQILTIAADTVPVGMAGAALCIAAPPDKVGMLAGDKIAQILKGKKPSQIPIEGLKNFEVWLNMVVAKKINLNVPTAVVRMANKIITE